MSDPSSLLDDLDIEQQSYLDLPAVRDRRDTQIEAAFDRPGPTLIEALPAMGKSYGLIEWAAKTGKPLTVFTARHDLYEQYIEWAEDKEAELRILRLPTPSEDCPSMASPGQDEEDAENAEALRKNLWSVYDAGITAAQIHQQPERYVDEPLPCQQDGECPYMEARNFDPTEFDVLVGHYLQAHNRKTVDDRYVAFDEFPGDAYFFEPTHNVVTRAVSNYLEQEDTLPFENWKHLDYNRKAPEHQDAVESWIDDLGFYSHRDASVQLQQSPDFHAHAPLMTHAALTFDLLSNEWEYATLGSDRRAVKSPDDEWTFLLPPPLHEAESVVALDGTPTITKWRLALGGGWVHHEELLESPAEKREYLREVLNIGIIQTEAGSKPYQSGNHVNIKSDGALFEGIEDVEGETASVITSKKALEQYEEAGVTDLIDGAEHYGNLKGSNEFAKTRVGAVVGSPHPPEDEAVERWAALDGDAVQREEEDGWGLKGGNLSFGPKGNALFRGVVHNEVLQAVLRFGRTESDGERGARVYVHTSRLPQWVKPEGKVKLSTWSDGMHEVVDVIKDSEKWPHGEWMNKEIAEQTAVGVKQVGELMKELDEEGYVSHRRGGRGNAYQWSNERLEDFTAHGRMRATV